MGLVSFLSDKLTQTATLHKAVGSIFDFKIKSIEGELIDFNQYRGKKLMIVNTASKCGFTSQYAVLESLSQQHGDTVTVLGFPSNNFLWQEPGADKEIASFCEKNYGVSFQLFSKISVKGRDKHPLYKWLEAKTGKAPSWNFCKYLVSEDGSTVQFYQSAISPMDPQIVMALIG